MARDLNHGIIVGRIANDIEVKQTKNGVEVVDFTIANNRDYGDNERVNWIRCRAYKKLATMMGQYVKKGIRVGVGGEWTVDRWQDDTGAYRERAYLLVNDFQFLDSNKSENTGSTYTPAASQKPANTRAAAPQYESYEPYDEFDDEF